MKRVLSLFAGTFLLVSLGAAQETRATIQGVVKDSQGGVVAAATVLVTNLDTNMSVSLKTDQTGRYQAPLLLPGNYVVTGEAPGFKKSVRAGITLALTDIREVEIVLQVGAITESVTVSTEAPLIDATRTDSGRVIDDRSVQDLPVMANTVFTMIRYSAGVQGGAPPSCWDRTPPRAAPIITTEPVSAATRGPSTAPSTMAMHASPPTFRRWRPCPKPRY